MNQVYIIGTSLPKILSGADPKTFVVLGDDPFGYTDYLANGGTAKDDKNVYTDGEKISGVDAKSFVILNTHFKKDSAHVYMGTTTISNDPKHFWGDPDGSFAIDSNTIYYTGKPIPGVDLATFTAQRTYPYYYGIDAYHVYDIGSIHTGGILIPEADSASFVVIDDSNNKIKYMALDKNHFFYNAKIIQ